MMNLLELNMSRVFKCSAKELFNSIGKGALFFHTGVIKEKFFIDFKIGGIYKANWEGCADNTGEFLEIKPYEKIVFSWCYFSKELNADQKTRVTINIVDNGKTSTLSLKHEGFHEFSQIDQHHEGWASSLETFIEEFNESFHQNKGPDLDFTLTKKIEAPIEKVFQAVKTKESLEKYFVKASESFESGHQTVWDFENYPDVNLEVFQVIENEIIEFVWDNSRVCFSFSAIEKGTIVTIHVSCQENSQKALKSQYDECEGWSCFLTRLKFFCEDLSATNLRSK